MMKKFNKRDIGGHVTFDDIIYGKRLTGLMVEMDVVDNEFVRAFVPSKKKVYDVHVSQVVCKH